MRETRQIYGEERCVTMMQHLLCDHISTKMLLLEYLQRDLVRYPDRRSVRQCMTYTTVGRTNSRKGRLTSYLDTYRARRNEDCSRHRSKSVCMHCLLSNYGKVLIQSNRPHLVIPAASVPRFSRRHYYLLLYLLLHAFFLQPGQVGREITTGTKFIPIAR